MSKIISSIDIGNSKIICLIAQLNDENRIYIKSASIYESRGIVNSNIVDIDLITQSIVKTIAKAEKIFKKNIDTLSVNISGDKLKSKEHNAEIDFTINKIIDKRNIFYLSKELKTKLENDNKTLIHAIPVNYFVNKVKVENPIGMSGNNLKIQFHTFYTNKNKIDNFVNCFKKIQLKVDSFVFSAYASALATMTEEEKKMNILVIDLGSLQTSFALMIKNKFVFGHSIPMGGATITMDIANVLKTDFSVAENIKLHNTNLFFSEVENREFIKINISNNDKELYRISHFKKGLINNIFKERILEIIEIIIEIIKNKGFNGINKIILCGGTAKVLGVDIFINEKIKIDTRVGYINGRNFLISHMLDKEIMREPIYATSIGILQYIVNSYRQNGINTMKSGKNNFVNKVIDFLINLFIS